MVQMVRESAETGYLANSRDFMVKRSWGFPAPLPAPFGVKNPLSVRLVPGFGRFWSCTQQAPASRIAQSDLQRSEPNFFKTQTSMVP